MPWMAAVIPAVASLAGAGISAAMQSSAQSQQAGQFAENIAQQREFAQHGIRWKVADAQAAGVHPLFALGANTTSFSPISTFQPSGDAVGPLVAQAGQNLGRAIASTSTAEERQKGLMAALQLERAGLENDLLRSQIARTAGQIGPPFPTGAVGPGGVSTGDIARGPLGTWELDPTKVTSTLPGNPGMTAGPPVPTVQWGFATNGALQPFPAPGLKIEDEFLAPLMTRWIFSDWLPHNFGPPERQVMAGVMAAIRSRHPNAVGAEWSHRKQGFVPVYGGDGAYLRTRTQSSGRGQSVTVPMPDFPGFGPQRR